MKAFLKNFWHSLGCIGKGIAWLAAVASIASAAVLFLPQPRRGVKRQNSGYVVLHQTPSTPNILERPKTALGMCDDFVAAATDDAGDLAKAVCETDGVGREWRNDPDIEVHDGQFIWHPHHVWDVGQHSVKFRGSNNEAAWVSQTFNVEWAWDFATAVGRTLFGQLGKLRGRAEMTNAFVLLNPDQDLANASEVAFPCFTHGIDGYRVAFLLDVEPRAPGCIQVVLPGGLTCQIADGDPNTWTVKVGANYVGTEGWPSETKRRDAFRCLAYSKLKLTWVWISYRSDLLTICLGSPDNPPLLSHIVKRSALNMNLHVFGLRSFGSLVRLVSLRASAS